jgi:hypothetical protein
LIGWPREKLMALGNRLGGGFKENDKIEYIERNTDNDMYDEVRAGRSQSRGWISTLASRVDSFFCLVTW